MRVRILVPDVCAHHARKGEATLATQLAVQQQARPACSPTLSPAFSSAPCPPLAFPPPHCSLQPRPASPDRHHPLFGAQIEDWRKLDVKSERPQNGDQRRLTTPSNVSLTKILRELKEQEAQGFSAATAAQRRKARETLGREELFAAYPLTGQQEGLSAPDEEPEFMTEEAAHRFVVTCNELLMDMNMGKTNVRGVPGKERLGAARVLGAFQCLSSPCILPPPPLASTLPFSPSPQPEPFFCSLLLVDLEAEDEASQVLSERFYFDLNGEQQGDCVMTAAKADIETRSRRAIFAVPKPHARIFLVLLVDKLLQGDLSSATETYIKVRVPGRAGQNPGKRACAPAVALPSVTASRGGFNPMRQ